MYKLGEDDEDLLALQEVLSDGNRGSRDTNRVERDMFVPRLREDNTFGDAFSYDLEPEQKDLKTQTTMQAQKADEIDSSDEEEVKNFLERKYNEYGSDIKQLLVQERVSKEDLKVTKEVDAAIKEHFPLSSVMGYSIKNPHHIKHQSSSFKKQPQLEAKNAKKSDSKSEPTSMSTFTSTSTLTLTNEKCSTSTAFVDPIFGFRIINPLVSSAVLVERMAGRKAVSFSNVAFHTQRGDLSKDWVIAGVVVHKNPVRTTKKGEPYSIWRLSDLKGEIKMLSLFLFRGAHKDLWKTTAGNCIAVLNPNIFEKRAESGDVACLSIDTAQKVMILGKSKDMGMCKARKRNGEPCTAIVNLSDCDYCIFHMKQEFSKMSKRSELQSATAGRGLNELRNKVLGKSEVFYGGQSFSSVPARKSVKLVKKDMERLSSLSEYTISPFAGAINHSSKSKANIKPVSYAQEKTISKVASNIETSAKQRLKDLERLRILEEHSKRECTNSGSVNVTISDAESTHSQQYDDLVPDKFKGREFSFSSRSPCLSRDNFCIEVSIDERQAENAKRKAALILKKHPVEKGNPNSTRGTKDGKRRAIDDLNEKFDKSDVKRPKLQEEKEHDSKSRIQRIMEATSSHSNLIDLRGQEEQEKYFSKLEKKEALEEKMLQTYKMPCKAVICLNCKYTAFSAAERCKEEKHILKVVDAEKRFFECKDCGNRTASVFRLPKSSCNNCKGSRWQRAAMIRERKVKCGSETLSIRGDEEKFINSLATVTNLNLLIPDK